MRRRCLIVGGVSVLMGVGTVMAQNAGDSDLAASTDPALVFLALRQQSDGSIGGPEVSPEDRVRVTTASLLAFLSCGHPMQEGRFGRVLVRMTDFLVGVASLTGPGGVSSTRPTSQPVVQAELHAEIVLALSQALGAEADEKRREKIAEALTKVVGAVTARDVAGLDVPGAARVVVALRAAKMAGVEVSEGYVAQCKTVMLASVSSTGAMTERVGGGAGSNVATAAGLLALILSGDAIPAEVYPAIDYLTANQPGLTGESRMYAAMVMQVLPPRLRPAAVVFVPVAQEKDGALAPASVGSAEQMRGTAQEVMVLTSPWRVLPAFRKSVPMLLTK